MVEIKGFMANYPKINSELYEIWELESNLYYQVMIQKWFRSDEVQRYLQYTNMVEIKGIMINYPQIYSQL